MKFLIYTADPKVKTASLSRVDEDINQSLGRMMDILEDMSLERVLENQSTRLLVDDIRYEGDPEVVHADIYKDTNQGRALHQFSREGDEVTIEEVLSEDEEAFQRGLMGVKEIDGTLFLAVENTFGSYFAGASLGMDLHPRYSSEAIRAIQNSDQIGETTFDFSEDYDLTASLARPPQDGDLREEEGFGLTDPLNDILSMMNVSRTHQITVEIPQSEWMDNVGTFEGIIQSDIVSTIKIETPTQGIVRLGEGGDRAIRETVEVSSAGRVAVRNALNKLEVEEDTQGE
ncbi:hypothetical protein [Halolamina salifodinae]|uniref:Uncharacterized protein n=1 Tax=Halolamina salifodinae TaxID=1202767 RepID=A0A8T4GVV6_9EURY|nr:hypothetical protein [Halolamina salifodinae]MBP1987251.1 hypothetical protein [Halolamina salifodinae]